MNKGIQGLKGLLCIFIILFHYTFRYQVLYGNEITSWSFKDGSAIGVTLFFVISGYLFQKSVNRFNDSYTAFLRKKFLSLYPSFCICLTLTFIVKIIDLPRFEGVLLDYVKNLFFISLDLEGATWYLRSLFFLYFIVFPLSKLKCYKETIVFLLCLFLILDYYGVSFMGNNIINSLPKFLIGICLSFILNEKNYQFSFSVCIVMTVILCRYMPLAYSFLFSIILYGLLLNEKWLQLFFSNKCFLFLGSIFYVLYLLHQNIGYIIMTRIAGYINNGNIVLIISILIIIVLAYIVNLCCGKIQRVISSWALQ